MSGFCLVAIGMHDCSERDPQTKCYGQTARTNIPPAIYHMMMARTGQTGAQ